MRRTRSTELSLRLAEKYHIENSGGSSKDTHENPPVLDNEKMAASAEHLTSVPVFSESLTEIKVENEFK